ncbi:MAG: energy transducer TonB, partial [Bacteroidota bacterium]
MSRKLEIVIDNTPVTAEDAAAYQDFGKVLQGHKAALRLQRWKWAGIGGGALGLGVLAMVAFWPAQPEPDSPVDLESIAVMEWQQEEPLPAKPAPEVVLTPEMETIQPTVAEVEEMEEAPQVVTAPVSEPEEEPEPQLEEGTFSPTPAVLVEAEPWDGFPALYEFLRKETQYPTEALPDSVEGIVWVAFQIDTTGRPQKVRVVESLHPLLDHEATR